MKIYEAIAMLEQMDQTKECTVTFGQPKSLLNYPGTPFQQYAPFFTGHKPAAETPYITCQQYTPPLWTKTIPNGKTTYQH